MNRKFHILLAMALLSSNANSLDLSNSVPCDYGKTARTADQIAASQVIGQVIGAQNFPHQICEGYTNMGNGDVWYELEDSLNIYSVNVASSQYLGGWSVTDYGESVKMKGEGVHWNVRATLAANAEGGYNEITDPEAQQVDGQPNYTIDSSDPSLGCYNQKPLRYVDVDGDLQQELVLFLDDNFVLFSTTLKKPIFSVSLYGSDELSADIAATIFENREDNIFQYMAYSSTGVMINGPVAATRSFAKLFFSDVNDDNEFDIVVWRKLYESRLKSDVVLGFYKVADLYVHYTLVGGEYKLQSTDQETIKDWLTAKQFTWNTGFPSESECAGQEGQLIPEMHDLLLNDSDIL